MAREKPPDSVLAQIARAAQSENGLSWPDDSEAREKYPTLFELLFQRYPGGDVVLSGASISIRAALCGYSVGINHPTFKSKCSVFVSSLSEALPALEAQAKTGTGWVTYGRGEIVVPKRKKKN